MTDEKDIDTAFDPALERALLEAVASAAPPDGLRERVLARVRLDVATGDFNPGRAEGAWKPVLPGVEVKTLYYDRTQDIVSFLLRAQPGASMPAHRHTAPEECLVLHGDFTMGDLTLHAGDFELGMTGQEHPVAHTRNGVLVYLRGSAQDYPFARP